MRRSVWPLAVLIALVACSTRDTVVDTALPVGTITNVNLEPEALSFQLGTERGDRTIKVLRKGMTIVSSISTSGDQPLFEIEVSMDEYSLYVSERTPDDALSITHTKVSGGIEERTQLNGNRLVVTYPEMSRVDMSKSFRQYEQGNYEAVDPQLLQAFTEFDEFYDTNNSLHWNPEGELLIATLFSPELSKIISAQSTSKSKGPQLACKRCLDVYCAGVGVLTGLKCLFGGPANLLCTMGTVVGIACALFELTCGVFGC